MYKPGHFYLRECELTKLLDTVILEDIISPEVRVSLSSHQPHIGVHICPDVHRSIQLCPGSVLLLLRGPLHSVHACSLLLDQPALHCDHKVKF